MLSEPKNPERILQGLDDIEKKEAALKELRLREWKRSEIDKLVQHYRDSPIYGDDALDDLIDHVALAESEGRVYDDVSPTLENLQARIGSPKAWVFTVADSVFLESYARQTQHNPRSRSSWEIHGPSFARLAPYLPDWVEPLQGAARAQKAMVAQDRRADLEDIGLTIAGAIPAWAEFFSGEPHIAPLGPLAMNREAPPEAADLSQAMSERFLVLEAVYYYLAEKYRTLPATALTLPMDEVLGLPMEPGMRWKSYPSVEAFRAELSTYRANTNRAWSRISEAVVQLDRTNRRAVEVALIKAALPTG